MLQEIHIRNYAVIENLTVEFHPGLNVLTGETGSGKSVLVDALDLALGGRSSPDVIRTGADRATVTVVFRAEAVSGSARNDGVGMPPPWFDWLEHYGVGSETEGEIMLRREIQASGRSRLLVNDQPVTLAAAKELAPLLVEVHGQGEHASLLVREAQLDLLDTFASTGEHLAAVRALFTTSCAFKWTSSPTLALHQVKMSGSMPSGRCCATLIKYGWQQPAPMPHFTRTKVRLWNALRRWIGRSMS